MADWPATVPFFKSGSDMTRSGPTNAVVRSQMGVGPDKTRGRTTAAAKDFSGRTSKMTAAQFVTFEAWFQSDIGMGADQFGATDPFDCVVRQFRFVGSYTARRAGAYIFVTARLEILP